MLKEPSNPRELLQACGLDGFPHLIIITSFSNEVLLLFFSRVKSISGSLDKELGCGLFIYFNREGEVMGVSRDIPF